MKSTVDGRLVWLVFGYVSSFYAQRQLTTQEILFTTKNESFSFSILYFDVLRGLLFAAVFATVLSACDACLARTEAERRPDSNL